MSRTLDLAELARYIDHLFRTDRPSIRRDSIDIEDTLNNHSYHLTTLSFMVDEEMDLLNLKSRQLSKKARKLNHIP